MSRVWIVLCVLVAGCAMHDEAPTIRDLGPVKFDFALYYAPEPTADPNDVLDRLLTQDFPSIDKTMSVTYRWFEVADYPPPTASALRYTAHGVTTEKHAEILQSTRVYVISFEFPKDVSLSANQIANDLVERLARATGGFPWDDECRLLYSVEEWRAKRVETWQGDLPDIRGHVNMHAYRNPELFRLITLGMRKFGLPDLVLSEIPSGNSEAAGNLINAFGQFLLEGGEPDRGRVRFRLEILHHASMREDVTEIPLAGATGEVRLQVKIAPWEDGDPNNDLWSLEFPDFDGATNTERALTAFASVFGAEDKIVQHPSGDDAMRQASELARRNFFDREADFRRGLEPNERLLVKTGFKLPSGTEYMWVEVTTWEADAINGTLANDSYYDKNLREGVRVTVKLDDVFDFIHYKPDGTEDGNETGKVLEQRQSN